MSEGSLGDLFCGSPREVLERLAAGDPLELAPRTEARLSERALLLDPVRVASKALAQVALRARRRGGETELGAFLSYCIERALEDALREDRETERRGLLDPGSAGELDGRYAFVCEAFGLEPAQARGACVRFNDLPLGVRRSFFALCVEKLGVEAWAAERRSSRARIEEDLRRAFEALSLPLDGRDPASEDRPGGER